MRQLKLYDFTIAIFLSVVRFCTAFTPLLHLPQKSVSFEETLRHPLRSPNINDIRPATRNNCRIASKMSLETNEGSSTTASQIDIKKVKLSSGTVAQVTTSIPTPDKKEGNAKKTPLVFIHGSFHADWCWTEHYFPFFTDLGYTCVAYCLRGTGGTPAGEGVKKVKIMDHVEDLEAFLEYIQNDDDDDGLAIKKPVIIAHSFGGPLVMKYLEKNPDAGKDLGGLAILCAVPPSGIKTLTMRGLRTRPLLDNWKITVGMAMKKCTTNPSNARALFFGGDPVKNEDGTTIDDFGISDEELERYQGYFQRDAVAVIDVVDLGKKLPSKCTDKDGVAPFASSLPPVLVLGAKDDFIVDQPGNEETAKFFGVEEVTVVDSPHDVMLGRTWQNAADAILSWIRNLIE